MKKDINELIDICNANDGKVLNTKDFLKLFGYSTKSRIWKTQARKFVKDSTYEHPKLYWELGSWVLITEKELMKLCDINDKLHFYWHMKSKYSNIFMNGEVFIIYPKDKVPWWMLKDYGGNL